MKPDPLYANLPAALRSAGRTPAQLLQQARSGERRESEDKRRAAERIAMLTAEKKQKK